MQSQGDIGKLSVGPIQVDWPPVPRRDKKVSPLLILTRGYNILNLIVGLGGEEIY